MTFEDANGISGYESPADGLTGSAEDDSRLIPAIEFRNVDLAFDEQVILDGISFKVRRGETKIVLGGSGSGKSTIINLILGLLKADGGEILVDGEDITHFDDQDMMRIRKKIGMVFQEGALFDSLSVYDNVAYRLIEENVDPDEIEH
ncbi:MAG: ATP-binding cassette domain-containing protein [Pyrinomonadaceae bacterium]